MPKVTAIACAVMGFLLTSAVGCRSPQPQGAEVVPPLKERPASYSPAPRTFALCADGLPTSGMWKCDPVFADVNGDGYVDLAALPRLGRGPYVWLGDGHGAWTESSEGLDPGDFSCGGGLGLADLNGDGYLDLAVADHCRGLYTYLGDGAGHWNMVTRALYPQDLVPKEPKTTMFVGAEDIAVGDVNSDGFLDLVAGGSDDGGINVYAGDGTGKNWTRLAGNGLPNTGWVPRVVLADVNDDGRLDLLASQHLGPRVWLNDGPDTWTPASAGLPTPTISGLYTGLAVGDVNEDGRLDLVIANWVDGPEVYLQQADGAWSKTADVFPEMKGGAIGLDVGDLDRDGHLDIVVSGRLNNDAGYVRGVFWLRGDGAAGWDYVRGSGLPDTGLSSTTGVALADVNGDGMLDIAAGSGLIVETVPGRTEPIIPQRLLLWCNIPPK
ncbi:MAG: VCBS repeat-containing protein [Planctomycetes bacterium]|nr:VCBS repeat-containing protein [Planctomycetota bacterium]